MTNHTKRDNAEEPHRTQKHTKGPWTEAAERIRGDILTLQERIDAIEYALVGVMDALSGLLGRR